MSSSPASIPIAGASAPWPSPIRAWYVVAVLNICYALAIVDRIVIGLLVDPIKADLGLSDTQMGLLQGLAFALFYSLFSLPIGFLVDRWSRVWMLTGGLLLWSLATFFSGLAQSFTQLFMARVAVGAGEATSLPVSSSIIGDIFPPEQRGKAFGVLNLGGTFGTGIAYLLGGGAIFIAAWMRGIGPAWLGEMRDWHLVYIMLGLPGIFVALLLVLTVREPVRRELIKPRAGSAGLGATFAYMRANWAAYLSLILGAVLSTMIINAAIAWFPTVIMRVHGWSPAQVGATFAVLGIPFGALSAISGGFLVSWFAKRGRADGPMLMIMLQSIFWMTFGTYKCIAMTIEYVFIAHVFTSIAAVWSVTAVLGGLVQITPNEMRGQAVAIYTIFSGLIGLSLGTAVVGLLSDHVYSGPQGIGYSLGTVYFFGSLLSIIVVVVGRRAFIAASDRATSWRGPLATGA